MPRQPEGKLARKVREFVTERGGRYFNIQGHEGSFQEVGIPDGLICFRGQFIGLELKQRGQDPTPRQRFVLDSILMAGGVAACIHSMEELRELWERLEERLDCEQKTLAKHTSRT